MAGRVTVLSVKFLALTVVFAAGCQSVETVEGPKGCSTQPGQPNHVPEFLVDKNAGHAPFHGKVDLRIVLALRDVAAAEALVSRPGLTAQDAMSQVDFAAKHLPTAQAVDAAKASLLTASLEVYDVTGAIISARGTAAAVRRAFATRLVTVDDHHAPNDAPTLPQGVRAISGLGANQPTRQWAEAQAGSEALTPAAIRRAYGVPKGAGAAGQTLAILALDGYLPADIADYCRTHKLREVPRREVGVHGHGNQVITAAGRTETTLDLSLVQALVPEAAELLVVLADHRSPHALLDAMNRVANPPAGEALVRNIACSWGTPETGQSQADIHAEGQVLLQLAVQGQQVYAASGDNGAYNDGTRAPSTDTPASNPLVVAVGGTSLFVGPDGLRDRETVWTGSGGGSSCFWPAPSWQRATIPLGAAGMRAVPDVAFNADPDPGYAITLSGLPQRVGGTSAAAPLWAAVGALVDEARTKKGLGPLGFAVPRLYAIASCPNTRQCFYDILTGSNSGNSKGPGFEATPGYDLCSGFGSPNVHLLINALAR